MAAKKDYHFKILFILMRNIYQKINIIDLD